MNRKMTALPGLEKLIDRLETGMDLRGRIVDVLDNHYIILRVLGNNILTESYYPFKKFDEVILHVQAVQPKLVFSIRPYENNPQGALYA